MTNPPTHYPPVSVALTVSNAAQALEFYHKAFGALELYRLIDPESGKIGHAEMTVNGGLIMLADEYPGHNSAPNTLGGTTSNICLMVDDVDAAVAKAASAGAIVTRPPKDQFYGHRCANLEDPFGHKWMLAQELEKVAPEEMQRRWNALK
jgi:PhnB protein